MEECSLILSVVGTQACFLFERVADLTVRAGKSLYPMSDHRRGIDFTQIHTDG